MTVITTNDHPIVDSSGQPAEGRILFTRSARGIVDGDLVTTTPGTVTVKDGRIARPATFDLPATGEGEGVLIVELFRNRGEEAKAVSFWVEVPDEESIEYADLPQITTPSAGADVPAWARELLDAIESVEGVNDVIVKDLITDPETQTGAALNATIDTAVGRFSLPNYGAAMAAFHAGTPTRIKWLTWGDSMAQGIFERLAPRLRLHLGGQFAGVYFTGSTRSVTAITSTGTITDATTAYDAWPTGAVSTFATGATRTYGVGGASTVCDTVKVYYVKEPGAGTFKVQIDGEDVEGFTSISAAGTLGTLGVVTLDVTRGAHTAKVVNLTGAVRIIGLGFEDSTVSGLVPINVSKGGLELPDAMGAATARANFAAFLEDVQPTIITHEMKESATWYQERLTQLLDVFADGAPLADVVLVATPEIGGTAHTGIPEQNATLRALAKQYGHPVFDADIAFGSYASALAHGLYSEGDTVHYNTAGKDYLAGLFAAATALFARAASTQSRDVSAVLEQSFRLGPDVDDYVSLMEQQSGFDVLWKLKRQLAITPQSGTPDASSWLIRPDNGNNQQIPNGVRVGTTGPFVRGINASVASFMTARGGGVPVAVSQRAYISQVQTIASASGAVTIDLSLGTVVLLTLTGNVTSWTFSNPDGAGQEVEVHFIQDATGGRTLAGKASTIDLAGGALTLSTGANKRDVIRFRFVSSRFVETSRSMNVG